MGELARSKIAAMRHDLRTPVGVIMGLAQVLQRELDDAEQQGDLAEIISSAERVLSMIDEFAGLVQSAIDEERAER